jgi:Tfp pilus assembly protein PilN
MLERVKKHILYGNRFCGIEHTSRNSLATINVSILKQSKKELNLESTFQIDSINEISKKVSKNQHAILVVNDKNVLSKTIESEQGDTLKLAYKAFPNINLEDFYFEILSQKNRHFISLCRKDYVQNIIENYTKQKLYIVDVSLGNNLIGNLSGFINKNQIYSSNARIQIENNQIILIEKDSVHSENYDINGLTVSNEYVLSFSGALKTVLKNDKAKTNFTVEKERLFKNYKQIRFFNQFLRIGGLFILGLLLINFFFFNHYFNKVNELKQISEINQSTKNQIIRLNETVSKKQKMVDDLLKNNGSKSSLYSNTIIHSLPKSILLSEFNYQPLSKRVKADKPIELEQNSITISGKSNDSEAFSNWISQLEQENWIDKVNIIDYGNSSSNSSDFKIKIVLDDE